MPHEKPKTTAELERERPPAGYPWRARWAVPLADNFHRYFPSRNTAEWFLDELLAGYGDLEPPEEPERYRIAEVRAWVERFEGGRWSRAGEPRRQIFDVDPLEGDPRPPRCGGP